MSECGPDEDQAFTPSIHTNADQTRTKQSTRIKLSRPPHAWVALAACLAGRDVEAVEGAHHGASTSPQVP